MKIPSLILKQLYTFGSLKNEPDGYSFALKNRLSDATLLSLGSVNVHGERIDPQRISFQFPEGPRLKGNEFDQKAPLAFPLRSALVVHIRGDALPMGKHPIEITFATQEFGELALKVKDAIDQQVDEREVVPYDKDNNFGAEIIAKRQEYVAKLAGAPLNHLFQYSFDPETTHGNVENFTGVAQIPIGFAGPLRFRGEHAQGEFTIPLATTEGTLVASYNRGMNLLNLCGGVITTVSADRMQRAPVFIFNNALEARKFREWVECHMDPIRDAAESTSRVAKLLDIDAYLSNKFAYLRFNYETGDAAGQNMVGRATFAACSWILDHCDFIQRFYLESNLATDKKASQVNIMRTRGKRVTAECTVKKDVLNQVMRVDPKSLFYHYNVANVGSILSGANNNGLHSANGITAMFIATGQDVANVSESSAAILYSELTDDGDLYMSLTIPSLIVATHGGGTGLATQRECLSILGCTERGSVKKFAEIVAGVALAGEISLASAISSLDWVSSHEKYGRNR
jgi:hydroxymethylglutaryl-CoA reductase (NADPH)